MQNQPPMFYREEAPSGEASHFVFSFWEFAVDERAPAPIPHEVFPDGCVSVGFYRNRLLGFEQLFISGITPKSIYVTVNPGDRIWGMRILPEACGAFFGAPPLVQDPGVVKKQLFEPHTIGRRFSPALREELSSCGDFSEAVETYERYARRYGVAPGEVDPRLARATRIFVESRGLAKVHETAREIGLSERQFERNYRRASGLTPKMFARICRFRATAVDMVRDSAQNWALRAAGRGFTDQSHLNREFSSLTGNSPVDFAENVSRIKHGHLLE